MQTNFMQYILYENAFMFLLLTEKLSSLWHKYIYLLIMY